jgi:CheY-like chemotaxis protein
LYVPPHRLTQNTTPTILVVDDHSDLRDALSLWLTTEGYSVVDAGNGAEALEHLRSGADIHGVIVDLDMPVMNGWEFLAVCRKNKAWRAIPMLVVTGMRISERRRRGLGDVMILPKPFDFDEVLASVRRAMIREVPVRATT